MIAALFLGIQLLGQTQAEELICDGDFPNATEVMMNLPRTYILQSAFNISTLDCAIQLFYNKTLRSQTHIKYNLIYVYSTGRYQDQPLYVRRVENYTIIMDNRPEKFFPPKRSLQILYSDKQSCMVTKNPNSHFAEKACSLLVTEGAFKSPPMTCTQAFRRHCGDYAHNYTDISQCLNRTDYN
uniref:Putative lipocalin n=1 Tax=Ixodes ricinus TaxID=34613 RepID=A0A6B0V0B9_IXORI